MALKLPPELRSVAQEGLDAAIASAQYKFVVFATEDEDGLFGRITRWPENGWLEGGLDELANCIETVALSERRVARGVKVLERGVRVSAGYLQVHAPAYVLDNLAEKLHQEAGEQSVRMAAGHIGECRDIAYAPGPAASSH